MRAAKPFKPRQNAQVGAYKKDRFHLGDRELALSDVVAMEEASSVGTDVDYFELDHENSEVDPLYRERVKTVFRGPMNYRVLVEYPEASHEIRPEGIRTTWPSAMWLPRRMVEDAGARQPFRGDVVRFWDSEYHNDNSVTFDTGSKPRGMYFTVTNVEDSGHMGDQASFTFYKVTLERNSEFTPEREMENE